MRAYRFLSLAPAILALAAPCCSSADADGEESDYTMPTVYVSASRIGSDEFASAGRRTLILDRDDIRRLAPQTITDLLVALPGVDIRVRGPGGVQTDLEVAGSTFSQVLVLVDGMRVNDPQTGHHTLNLPLDPEDLERVEILYGAGSSVHGPDAFGGVINLVPRKEPLTRLDVGANWGRSLDDPEGSAVGSEASIRYGLRRGAASMWVSAGKSRSDGYRAGTAFDGYRSGTAFDTDRVFVNVSVPAAGGQLRLQGGHEDKDFRAADFYAPFPSGERTQVWLYQARFSRTMETGRTLQARAYYRRHRDRFTLVTANPAFYENRHLNQLSGSEVFATVASGAWGHLVAGGEAVRETIDSNNLGEHQQNRGALFAEYGGGFGRWNLSAGLRTDLYVRGERLAVWRPDRHESFGWEASPSVGLSYEWLKGSQWFGSVGRSYRAPSFTDLYYEDPNNIGNADLHAERAWSYEGGVRLQPISGVRLEVSAFARFETDLVDFVRPQVTAPWEARNLGKVRTAGTNLTMSRSWSRARAEVAYTFVDKEQTLGEGLESKVVFTQPRHLLKIRLDHELPAGARAGWHLVARERRRLEDYSLVDVVVSRPFAYGRALLRVRNLTDERYEAVIDVPQPGRWVSLETQIEL